jgi:hypothetical protein
MVELVDFNNQSVEQSPEKDANVEEPLSPDKRKREDSKVEEEK